MSKEQLFRPLLILLLKHFQQFMPNTGKNLKYKTDNK